MIYLSEVITTQTDLRCTEQLNLMVEYIRQGGFWTQESLKEYANKNKKRPGRLIQISEFEDGVKYIHDGHHRSVSTWLGGRDFLREDEYEISNWSYSKYLQKGIRAFRNGWFTPFDPRTHVRLADIGEFKAKAMKRFKEGKTSPLSLARWIDDNCHLYVKTRETFSVSELAEFVQN